VVLRALRAPQAKPPLRRIRGRNRTKADILVYRLDGALIAVKDYGPRPRWIRLTLGRWLIRRELAAYRAAGGMSGLPRCLGRLDRDAFALEWIEARPLARLDAAQLPEGWFERARELVERLHSRGVALGDLHHRDLLLDAAGAVYVVDLATAWLCPATAGALRRRVFRRLCELDHVALARMRARAAGADPDEAVTANQTPAARWHRRLRALRRGLDRLRGR
jgi:hypothetical protein